jgi:hypothetical protein
MASGGVYQDFRFNENWNEIKPELESPDWSDKAKLVPLGDNSYANFGGQVRARYYGMDGTNFGDAASARTDLTTFRVRAHGDFHFGEHVRMFAEGIYSSTQNTVDWNQIGEGTRVSEGELLNAFIELKNQYQDWQMAAWAGRREMAFGHQRLVSPANWSSTRRTWDGGGMIAANNNEKIHVFYTRPVTVIPDGWNPNQAEKDKKSRFYGLVWDSAMEYTGVENLVKPKQPPANLNMELYAFGLERPEVQFNQATEDEKRYTFGALFSGKIPVWNLDGEVELDYQGGDFGAGSIKAYSLAAELGYSFGAIWTPRVWLGYDYASGDKDSSDNELNTFDPMFENPLAFFGAHGLMARKNLISSSANLDLFPNAKLMTRLSFWQFNRAQTEDALYSTLGTVWRAAGTNLSKDLGHQWQLAAMYSPTRHWDFMALAGVWSPGDFQAQSQSVTVEDFKFAAVTVQYSF